MRIIVAGAGIGGLTTALALHSAGYNDILVLEAARSIQQVGVGINLPPHAVRELVELGLGDALARAGLPTAALTYYDASGSLIWSEPRGLVAGYHWPQYSIHRGKLQQILLDAARSRLGPAAIATGQRVIGVDQSPQRVRVRTEDAGPDASATHEADLLIGADGIRSAVRGAVFGSVPLATNGWTMFRGASRGHRFLDGKTMVIVGDEHRRAVVYPLDGDTQNWLVVRPASADRGAELGNWNRPVDTSVVAGQVEDWAFDWLNIPGLVRAADIAYEYPMADIDPLPCWTSGRVTLLGDAAHPMYPFGSNGASQAILDARVLAFHLATNPDPLAALQAYECSRRPTVSAIQLANRRQAEDVMARVSAMARMRDYGAAATELKAVEQDYKRLAGFDVDTLNERASWSAGAAPSTPG